MNKIIVISLFIMGCSSMIITDHYNDSWIANTRGYYKLSHNAGGYFTSIYLSVHINTDQY